MGLISVPLSKRTVSKVPSKGWEKTIKIKYRAGSYTQKSVSLFSHFCSSLRAYSEREWVSVTTLANDDELHLGAAVTCGGETK